MIRPLKCLEVNKMNSYYGSYRTRTFADIYTTADDFVNDYKTSPMTLEYMEPELYKIYYLLYGKYGNSHIASSDETQFKFRLCSIIWQYGPGWKKQLDVQTKLQQMDEKEMLESNRSIYNTILNPATVTDVDNDQLLNTVNQQNTISNKRGKLMAYADLLALLKRDVTKDFLTKFKELFITVLQPDYPLLYEEDSEDGI